MTIIKTINQLKKLRKTLHNSIGFVPTMGYLHEGHLSLIKKSKAQNKSTIVSIFVNPKQFGKGEDFEKYPRDEKRDITLLKKADADILFLPNVDELYPKDYKTYTEVTNISSVLEGKSRPGHFRGVATIVLKLFNLTQPNRAYFGQKDAQQVVVIKKMVKDLNIKTEIIVGETKREKDGLAMSSRNVYLSEKQRKEAAVLFKSLNLAKQLFKKGERNPKKIKTTMQKLIKTTSGIIDYICIANEKTLEEVKKVESGNIVILAVKFGLTRLIDSSVF